MIDTDQVRSSNNELLTSWGILVNPHLPRYYSIDELTPASAQDVAIRSVVLTYILGVFAKVATRTLREAIKALGIEQFLSVSEIDLLNCDHPTGQETRAFEWTFEHLLVFSWCLGRDSIDPFTTDHVELSTENADLYDFFPAPFSDPSDFVEDAVLREFEEIYRTADLYYRLHWATVENRVRPHGRPLHEGVVENRRKAIDWVIGVTDDWDAVAADT